MTKKNLKNQEKNAVFWGFLAIFSSIFIIFFSFFSSAQIIDDLDFTGFNFSLESEAVMVDFQVLFRSGNNTIFALGNDNFIYEYNITDLDFNTILYTGNSLNLTTITGFSGTPEGFYVTPLGTKIYLSQNEGVGTQTTGEITLSTPFDLSTAVLDASGQITPTCISLSSPNTNILGKDLFISPDGTKLTILHVATRTIAPIQTGMCFTAFALSTPFDISSRDSGVTTTFQGSSTTNTIDNFFFTSTKGFITGRIGGTSFSSGNLQEVTITNYNSSTISYLASTTIAEITPISVQSSTTPITKFLFLGTYGGLSQLLEYNVLPEQIATIPDLNLGFRETIDRSFNNYFQNYGFVKASITDLETGQFASLIVGDDFNFTQFSAPKMYAQLLPSGFISGSGQTLRITSFSQDGTFSITFIACVDSTETTCVNDNFILNISDTFTGSQTAPTIRKNFPNINLFCTGISSLLNMRDYFSNDFTSIRLSYVDFILNESVIEIVSVGTPTTIVNNGSIYSAINTYENDILINFASNCLDYSQPITITAINGQGQVSQQFTLTTATSGTPTQQPTAPTGWVGSLIGLLEGVFPNEENLSIFQKMVYVFVTMMLVSMVILAIAFLLSQGIDTNNSGVAGAIMVSFLALTIIANVLMFFFFIAIGYINILIPIVIILGLIGLAILRWKSGGQ